MAKFVFQSLAKEEVVERAGKISLEFQVTAYHSQLMGERGGVPCPPTWLPSRSGDKPT